MGQIHYERDLKYGTAGNIKLFLSSTQIILTYEASIYSPAAGVMLSFVFSVCLFVCLLVGLSFHFAARSTFVEK